VGVFLRLSWAFLTQKERADPAWADPLPVVCNAVCLLQCRPPNLTTFRVQCTETACNRQLCQRRYNHSLSVALRSSIAVARRSRRSTASVADSRPSCIHRSKHRLRTFSSRLSSSSASVRDRFCFGSITFGSVIVFLSLAVGFIGHSWRVCGLSCPDVCPVRVVVTVHPHEGTLSDLSVY